MGARTNGTPRQPRRERWRLDRLAPNPLQSRYYQDLSEADLKALAKNILHRGQRQPIEALEDGTILDGHMRLAALRLNGATEADVLVRHDLADADDAEKERAFLESNVLRRQLTPIAKARAVLGLYLAERNKPRAKLYQSEEAEAIDRIGRAIEMSGRNLRRYFAVLSTPTEVQATFERGAFTLVEAARVAVLSVADQAMFASRLRAKEGPKAVFAAFFPPRASGHVMPADAVASFARALEVAHTDLADRVEDVRPGPVRANEAALRRGKTLIRRLLDKLDPPAGQSKDGP